jgi:hypothetical protein
MPTKINRFLWRKLILELRRRGKNRRESGAFLLGNAGSNRITRIVHYDDLDPHALDSGCVAIKGEGFARLWELCGNEKLEPIADIHTHGGSWTGQSGTDITNPFVAFPGHLSLIAPYFAQKNTWDMKGVGIYEYLGDHKWKTFNPKDRRVTQVLT